MAATRPNAALRRLFQAPVCLYRCKCGWLLGHRFLLLIHIGRRTGLRRCTVLEVVAFHKDGPEAVVISAFGRNAGWLRNIEAAPRPEVIVGRQHFVAAHRFLDAAEAMAVIAGYERRNRLAAPLVRRVLSRLLGWHYDGTPGARHRLIQELPLVAFRPGDPI